MPVCCRCNGKGKCNNCVCVRSGNICIDCLPSRRGHCDNLVERSEVRCDSAEASNQGQDVYNAEFATEPSITVPINGQSQFDPSPALPAFECLPQPNFVWGEVEGGKFSTVINEAYEDITDWRRNLFKVPSGKAGKAFVTEIARLLRAYAEAGALEAIALKSAMILPALLLQKPSASSKAKDHIQCLDRRLKL